jgi:hypothetical protein
VKAEGRNEVVILGAGFSHAVSEHLPLANELGDLAYQQAKSSESDLFREAPVFTDDRPFEMWLSLLAEDQPHLDESANRINAARFAILTRSIVAVLEERQALALEPDGPRWVYELISCFHERETTLVSLDYDTLIEVAVNSMSLGLAEIEGGLPRGFEDVSFGRPAPIQSSVSPQDIVGTHPPQFAFPRHAPEATMRLLKLHGSLDWWWVPNDMSGLTLARAETLSTFGNPVRSTEEQLRSLPGREPFIVPPLASKSPYYRNPLTRQLWREAFDALSTAERITLIGYSLPRTDVVMGGMLESAIRNREAQIEVVDKRPADVVTRLGSLGGPPEGSDRLVSFAGKSSVPDYAATLLDETSREVPPRIAPLLSVVHPSSREIAIVTWSHPGGTVNLRVNAARITEDGTLSLQTDPNVNYSVQPSGEEPTSRDLIEAMSRTDRIVAKAPDGHESVIVGFKTQNFQDRNARQILYLVAADRL